MYAIVKDGGLQFKAVPNSIIRVPLLSEEVGGSVTLDQVLLWSGGQETQVGAPFVSGKSVKGEVVRHSRSEKLRIFKKRARPTAAGAITATRRMARSGSSSRAQSATLAG